MRTRDISRGTSWRVFFDLEDIADHASPYAHMLPPAHEFAAKVGALGIDNNTRVVVYDTNYVSARAWWMFRLFGHDNIMILDGGLGQWIASGGAVEQGEVRATAREVRASARPELAASWQDVRDNLATRAAQLVPVFPSRPSRGRPSRAPLRRYPTPSCAACPAPAQVALRYAVLRAPPEPYRHRARAGQEAGCSQWPDHTWRDHTGHAAVD